MGVLWRRKWRSRRRYAYLCALGVLPTRVQLRIWMQTRSDIWLNCFPGVYKEVGICGQFFRNRSFKITCLLLSIYLSCRNSPTTFATSFGLSLLCLHSYSFNVLCSSQISLAIHCCMGSSWNGGATATPPMLFSSPNFKGLSLLQWKVGQIVNVQMFFATKLPTKLV